MAGSGVSLRTALVHRTGDTRSPATQSHDEPGSPPCTVPGVRGTALKDRAGVRSGRRAAGSPSWNGPVPGRRQRGNRCAGCMVCGGSDPNRLDEAIVATGGQTVVTRRAQVRTSPGTLDPDAWAVPRRGAPAPGAGPSASNGVS